MTYPYRVDPEPETPPKRVRKFMYTDRGLNRMVCTAIVLSLVVGAMGHSAWVRMRNEPHAPPAAPAEYRYTEADTCTESWTSALEHSTLHCLHPRHRVKLDGPNIFCLCTDRQPVAPPASTVRTSWDEKPKP